MEPAQLEQAVADGLRRDEKRRNRNAVRLLLLAFVLLGGLFGLLWWDEYSHPANARMRQVHGR